MLQIAFVSSEISPFATTGRAGEICGLLTDALHERGAKVTRFMPLYRRIMEGPHPVEDTGIRLSIPVGFHRYQADIWKARGNHHPETYFIRRDEFFDRSELYSLSDRDYDDNFERFIFFQKAVTCLIDHLGQPFDIVHAHDWQTGLLPLYLSHGMSGEGRSRREKVVFSVHDLERQGVFNGDYYSYTNLPFSCFSLDLLEYYGDVNCLKGGITTTDALVLPSPGYAREVQEPSLGHGLHGVFRDRSFKTSGIVNGVDYSRWNPEKDQIIARRYCADDVTAKAACKDDLLRRIKLKLNPDAPLIVMITRMIPDKGIELVGQALSGIVESAGAGFILMGCGPSHEIMDSASDWSKQWPGRVAVKVGCDEKLHHRLLAGADMLLVPAKTEPCGSNHLIALRYGTIPIVRRTGGLADTVKDADENPGVGTGFIFDGYDPQSMTSAISRAIDVFQQEPNRWQEIMSRGMSIDFSWQQVAGEYIKLYRRLLGRGDANIA
ncbi:MAG: glycogen synthase [Kiritimatiellia bacterium]